MSGKTIHLHIGIAKTGSTTIQSFLHNNRKQLSDKGYFFPVSPSGFVLSHFRLQVYAQDTSRISGHKRIYGLYNESQVLAFNANTRSSFLKEVESSPLNQLILSCESFTELLVYPHEITKLKDFLSEITDDVRIIIYLRRQDKLLASRTSQSIKNGEPEVNTHGTPNDFFESINRNNWRGYDCNFTQSDLDDHVMLDRYDYKKLLSVWAKVFGPQNINVRIFNRQNMVGQDLVTDFLDAIGLPIGPEFILKKDHNFSLGFQTYEFLRLLNEKFPFFNNDGRLNQLRPGLAAKFDKIENNPPFSLPLEISEHLLKMYYESNSYTARRFLGRADGELFPYDGPTRGHEQVDSGLSVEQSISITAHIIKQMSSERIQLSNALRIEKSNSLFVLGLLYTERGNINKAIETYNLSLQHNPQNTQALNEISKVFLTQGHSAKAIEFARQAVRIDCNNAHYHFQLGLALERHGQYSEARSAISDAIGLNKSISHFHTGLQRINQMVAQH